MPAGLTANLGKNMIFPFLVKKILLLYSIWLHDNSYQNLKCTCLVLKSVDICPTDASSYINLEFIQALFEASKEICKTLKIYKYRLIKAFYGLSGESNSNL